MPEGKFKGFKRLKRFIPSGLRPAIKGLLSKVGITTFKYNEELNYWRQNYVNGKWKDNGYYQEWMLHILAKESSQSFLADKIVADFGCGPMGSLNWATEARLRIGIDVLSDAYSEFDINAQNMVYVISSETRIPLPSNYVDVLFACNSLDHVANLPAMCGEILRVLRQGGTLVGSFNMNEPGTFSEPQTLTEETLNRLLLNHFDENHRLRGVQMENRIVYRGIKKVDSE
jgi:SAM-dependent methyltransferase